LRSTKGAVGPWMVHLSGEWMAGQHPLEFPYRPTMEHHLAVGRSDRQSVRERQRLHRQTFLYEGYHPKGSIHWPGRTVGQSRRLWTGDRDFWYSVPKQVLRPRLRGRRFLRLQEHPDPGTIQDSAESRDVQLVQPRQFCDGHRRG